MKLFLNLLIMLAELVWMEIQRDNSPESWPPHLCQSLMISSHMDSPHKGTVMWNVYVLFVVNLSRVFLTNSELPVIWDAWHLMWCHPDVCHWYFCCCLHQCILQPWSWVNVGSGNGLIPNDTKPLPEPMLTYPTDLCQLVSGQFIQGPHLLIWFNINLNMDRKITSITKGTIKLLILPNLNSTAIHYLSQCWHKDRYICCHDSITKPHFTGHVIAYPCWD